MTFFKNYAPPTTEALASLGLIVISVWISVWIPSTVESKDFSFGPLLELSLENYSNFKTPVPWLALTSLASLVGRIEGFYNRYKLNELDDCRKKLETTEADLRTEIEAHAESKSGYFETLNKALSYLLRTEDFNETCRVTVYKMQNDDATRLHRIFRYSPHAAYESSGRLSIPSNQGIVGAAWNNHGELEFSHASNPDTATFKNEMQRRIQMEGCNIEMPEGDLSMKSRFFYAKRVNELDSGQRTAIVVYESTVHQGMTKAKLDAVLDDDALDVARFIRHIGALSEDFQPISRGVK